MFAHSSRLAIAALVFGAYAVYTDRTPSQELLPPPGGPVAAPEFTRGVEVQARGPIHEAFASPLTEPKATPLLAKKPPAPLEEMPPEEKPEGDVVWIGGYSSWDDDRGDFLWVSGCWRVKPAGKEWVPGYWREVGVQWQWVPGFWTAVQEQKAQAVTYYPEPPAPPNVAPPGDPPRADMIYVPGYWMWTGERYVWRAGYYTPGRAGYVYVPSHYRWTPFGHVYVAGYWDLAVSRRGVLYAPVVVDINVVGPRYVYTPHYAVRDTIVLDCLFVRPAYGAYYFGDYYGPRYVAIGFEPGVVYSRRHYEPIIVYERWHYRDNPRWHETQITLVVERNAGRAPLPPRTLNVTNVTNVTNVKNVTNVNNVTNINNVIAPTKTVLAAQGQKSVPLSTTARAQVQQSTQAAQQTLTTERKRTESAAGGPPTKPRTSALNVPVTPPAGGRPPASAANPKIPGVGNPNGIAGDPKVPVVGNPKGIAGDPKVPVVGNPKGKSTPPPPDPKGTKTPTPPDVKGKTPPIDPGKGPKTGPGPGPSGKKDDGKKKGG